jgi:hypothetical protein
MKHLLLSLIIFLTANVSHGQSNSYHAFPDSAFWRVDMHCQYAQTNCDEYYYYAYHFGGDTLLNGSMHKKIMRDSVVLVGIGGPPCLLFPWASFTGYMGALKEDPINNKTFLVWPGHSNDTLLYDYNLTIGDTLKGFLSNNCIMTVTTIDSVLLGAEYRKRWNFNTCNEGPGYIIQGIGSQNGLIERINSSGFCFSQLVCVNDSNNFMFYVNSSAVGCYLIFTELNPKIHTSDFTIYPNPFSRHTTIQTEVYLNNATLTLHNLQGQTVKKINHIYGHTITLDRDNLPCGLYFLKLTQENKVIATKKVVITD